ncbi:hypothetical protein OAV67_02475 [Alphaproteobacteria bacterium]|jgi:hypothetical protein|nr:hypothetical protein [Alphaproteobacteria bacterium]
MRLMLNFYLLSFFMITTEALAAGGPIAKGFGADDWMDKLHVVLTVVGLVAVITITLVTLILRKKSD